MTGRVQLLVRGGTVVSPGGSRRAHVVVDGGMVVAVEERDGDLPEAATVIDAAGLHVLPGLIDADVKFRDPGLEYKEGWDCGSLAAVCGGITTVVDMPNVVNPVASVAELQAKREAAAGRAHCDYALMATLDGAAPGEMLALAASGVCGFRTALSAGFGRVKLMGSGELLDAWTAVAPAGLRCSVVPETRDINEHFRAKVRAAGRGDGAAWRDARPPAAEVEGIARAWALAEIAGVRLCIATLSSIEGIGWIRRAKDCGRLDLVAEAKVHYCLIDGAIMDTERLGSMLAMVPPVRTREHADALLAAVADGTIDSLATDHSPHTRAEKHYDDRMGDIWGAMPGWPGVETSVSLMLTAVNAGRLSIERYAMCQSEAPARSWGLWPRKGRIARGADADLTLVDLSRTGVFDEARLHSRHRLSPFHGRAYRGAPVCTVLGGVVVARDGEPTGMPPGGRFVAPSGN